MPKGPQTEELPAADDAAHSTSQELASPEDAVAESDLYRQLLDQLTSNADGNNSTVNRMVDIRRQLTEFQLHYKFGMDEVLTKINVLREEFEHTRDYSPIEHVNYRLKSLERILDKVQRYGAEPTLEGIRHAIRDIAGIRITCSFVSDAYWVAEMLCSQPDVRVVEVKDYIRTPKVNGYQSLHVILQVPVFLSNRTEFVYVEVQIRTVAMDFWASLEHKIYYTYDGEVPSDILDELRDAADKAAELDQQMAEIRDKVTALRQQAPSADQPDPAQWFAARDAAGDPDAPQADPQGNSSEDRTRDGRASADGPRRRSPVWNWDDIVRDAEN
ncbi:GTP pyrophosphokinase [Nesterenkonia alba]|uniref:GTP pyrophosphokinase n=1 Tax=Nesterenkonia alba TaxID=515814 RepID=UPI0003B4F346|nr:GTP pyrophosphokinase family protein [Nesterenkonia alba]